MVLKNGVNFYSTLSVTSGYFYLKRLYFVLKIIISGYFNTVRQDLMRLGVCYCVVLHTGGLSCMHAHLSLTNRQVMSVMGY